ncbi:hypothetical protein NDU88_002200 [Pleurodeles waltl]|uniref:Uncharacterized protein n=1 Tax=Pleurodeles waltl TaxID=8319 RepID=A0AAV7T1P3_PLEWA|nr:hypothetical protein NDU88_002200 [Pleurodeles waltl]
MGVSRPPPVIKGGLPRPRPSSVSPGPPLGHNIQAVPARTSARSSSSWPEVASTPACHPHHGSPRPQYFTGASLCLQLHPGFLVVGVRFLAAWSIGCLLVSFPIDLNSLDLRNLKRKEQDT